MLSAMQQIFAVRMRQGMDLKKELQAIARANNFLAAYILSCVGSLQAANLRMAGAEKTRQWDEKMEILSLVGTLYKGGCHLHLCLSDSSGNCFGGHLMDGCIIYTTAEVIVGEALGLEFNRAVDPTTGYLELSIQKRAD